MEKILLGRTNLSVSRAGLGGGGHSRLGKGYGSSFQSSVEVVKAGLDAGINFLDTASVYGTEEIVGEAIKDRRDQVVLSTKGPVVRSGSSALGDDFQPEKDFIANVENSLRNLKTDYIDVYHLHGVMPDQYDACVDRYLPILKNLQAAGKIRYIGITERFIFDPCHEMLDRALVDDFWDVVMVGFNLINPSARQTVLPLTSKNNVGVLNMFAVRNVLGNPDHLVSFVEKLIAEGQTNINRSDLDSLVQDLLAATSSGMLTESAYRFCAHEPDNQVILTGTGKIGHLHENVAAIGESELPGELRQRLEVAFGHINSVSGD